MANTDPPRLSLLQLLLWPVRSFVETREFVSRIPSAGLSITLVGQILGGIGLSPAISSAVSILGLVTVFAEVVLKVLTMSKEPLKDLGLKNRSVAFTVYFLFGLGYFMVFGPGTFDALGISITQYLLGLVITYITGTIFMITWRYLEMNDANISWLITGSMAMSVGILALGFYTIDKLLMLSDSTGLREALFNTPANVSDNATLVSTDPGQG